MEMCVVVGGNIGTMYGEQKTSEKTRHQQLRCADR